MGSRIEKLLGAVGTWGMDSSQQRVGGVRQSHRKGTGLERGITAGARASQGAGPEEEVALIVMCSC